MVNNTGCLLENDFLRFFLSVFSTLRSLDDIILILSFHTGLMAGVSAVHYPDPLLS